MTTGKDLIALGFEPAPWFKEALIHINEKGLTGEDLVVYATGCIPPPPPPMIPIHSQPVNYHLNLYAESEAELGNLEGVTATMDKLMKTPTIVGGAVMPDACPAGPVGTIPVGGVVVAKNAIHPGMHSADICCSVMLTNFGKIDPKKVLDTAEAVTHFGIGGRGASNHFKMSEGLITDIAGNKFLNSEKSINYAKSYLGTQGNGNHFLSVGILKSTGETVLVTHHGSRGFGALLYKKGMEVAEEFRQKLSKETSPENAWIPYDTLEGEEYWKALQIVRQWTKENHAVLHDSILGRTKTKMVNRFWNEHNFVFKDGDLFYHAKGATPVDKKFMPDITGPQIIPLNMAESILLVEGSTIENNLGFAPHGAGRNLSRSGHKLLLGDRTVDEIFKEETKGIDARSYTKKVDITELPSAYKNAATVKAQIAEYNLAQIVDEILPYGNIMAGEEEPAHWQKLKALKRLNKSK